MTHSVGGNGGDGMRNTLTLHFSAACSGQNEEGPAPGGVRSPRQHRQRLHRCASYLARVAAYLCTSVTREIDVGTLSSCNPCTDARLGVMMRVL